jgi:hypothetical protein
MLQPGLSGFRPIPPGEGEPFTNEDRPDIETTDRHAGEGAAIAVLTAPDDIDRPSPQQTGQPLLGLEPEHEFPFTARAACFGRVDVQDPHPLRSKGERVPVDDDRASAVERLGKGRGGAKGGQDDKENGTDHVELRQSGNPA